MSGNLFRGKGRLMNPSLEVLISVRNPLDEMFQVESEEEGGLYEGK